MRLSARLIPLLATLLVLGCDKRLSFDDQGVAHGSGERTYKYTSGEIKLREDYKDGRLVRSRWFKPNGVLIQETRWANGTGEGLYLSEDGSIRMRMKYVNGFAEGEAIEYGESGNAIKVTYHDGQKVEPR